MLWYLGIVFILLMVYLFTPEKEKTFSLKPKAIKIPKTEYTPNQSDYKLALRLILDSKIQKSETDILELQNITDAFLRNMTVPFEAKLTLDKMQALKEIAAGK